mmetsp:Transcript_2685/g.3058  ORF Transcript_2685/g.3058 Transcript_2685/m.3058 type:complete len:124 (-) Transcript_2685:729-1100(-)
MGDTATSTNVRFRMHDGTDIGPILLEKTMSVQGIKEKLLADWVTDNSSEAKPAPKTIGDMKLILSGQVLDNVKILGELKLPNVGSDSIVTMHLVIRLAVPPKSGGEAAETKPGAAHRCRCIIS